MDTVPVSPQKPVEMEKWTDKNSKTYVLECNNNKFYLLNTIFYILMSMKKKIENLFFFFFFFIYYNLFHNIISIPMYQFINYS